MPKAKRAHDQFAKYKSSGLKWDVNKDRKSPNDPLVLFTVCYFNCPCKHPDYAEWESPWPDAINGEVCDNPDCQKLVMPSEIFESPTSCTFSDTRFFGEYQCHKCLRFWLSAFAWGGAYEQCESCLIKIYPFNMRELERGCRRRNSDKGHQVELCGKCYELGYDCSGGSKNASNSKRYRRATSVNRGKKKSKKGKSTEKKNTGLDQDTSKEGLITKIEWLNALIQDRLKLF